MKFRFNQGKGLNFLSLIFRVSREHREELAKCAKVLFNQFKVKLDHHFNDAMRKVRKSSSMEVVKTIEKKVSMKR